VGTFVYSAPEMLIGNDSGVKADIYSFGVVLWEIITGAIAKRGRLHEPKARLHPPHTLFYACRMICMT
jgi:serine/threonine protein kinase